MLHTHKEPLGHLLALMCRQEGFKEVGMNTLTTQNMIKRSRSFSFSAAMSVIGYALLLSLGMSFFTHSAHAAPKTTCKVTTNDIGTIIGRGENHSEAFEDAATQCFERRQNRYLASRGSSIDEETNLVMIDACVNIRCH